VWRKGRALAHDPKNRVFKYLLVCFPVTALGKLLTHICLCHQAVLFGTGQWAVTLSGWEGNRRPGGK